MSTQATSVSDISTYATAAVGVTTLSITSGVLVADTLTSVTGYTTLQIATNGAHVIDIPSTFLTTSGATLTVTVSSTIGVSLTGANLIGSSTALDAITGVGDDTLIGGPGADAMSGGFGADVIRAAPASRPTPWSVAVAMTASGGDGNDVTSGGGADDLIYGNNGADS